MYLAGPVIEVRGSNGQIRSFDSISVDLDIALREPGAVATNAYLEQFAGGWLANGCPLNVYFGGGWLPGQQEALRAAGKTACLPAVPQSGSSPTVNAILAPSYQPGGFTATGQRVVPGGGVQNPSAPIIIQTPSGPALDFDDGTPATPITTNGDSGFGSIGMLALGALAVGFFLTRKKG